MFKVVNYLLDFLSINKVESNILTSLVHKLSLRMPDNKQGSLESSYIYNIPISYIPYKSFSHWNVLKNKLLL